MEKYELASQGAVSGTTKLWVQLDSSYAQFSTLAESWLCCLSGNNSIFFIVKFYFNQELYFTRFHFFNKIAEICWIKFCYLQNVSSFFKSTLKFCWNLNLNSEVISNNLFLIQGIASWHCSS